MRRKSYHPVNFMAFVLCGLCASARADQPLSAIDWLSQSVATTAALPVPTGRGGSFSNPVGQTEGNGPERPGPGITGFSSTGSVRTETGATGPGAMGPGNGARGIARTDISRSAAPEAISVRPLDGPQPDAVGLLAQSVTGLPRSLWGATPEMELARMLRAERIDTLPSVQALLYVLLLAELSPPVMSDGRGALLLARTDKLLDLGAVDQVAALLDLAGTDDPDRFRRAFDVALLLGEEDAACRVMLDSPGIAPTLTARIFCLARSGDWNAAALTLRSAEALGQITTDENALLSRFLDPDLSEGDPPLPAPLRPSPLVWRMLEAIGEPIATATLPVAFAQADLQSNTGWKAQIEAAERLARTGAIPANRLMALYTRSTPAASGGVWDRAAAIQALDAAVRAKDAPQVSRALPAAWDAMMEIELEAVFAGYYGEDLAAMTLEEPTRSLAHRIGLLSPAYESVAAAMTPADDLDRFAAGVARGTVEGLDTTDGMTRAIAAGFAAPAIDPEDARMLAQGRLGEALLRAIDGITEGAKGNLGDVSAALALLRHVGLETHARRIALDLILLERRG